MLNYSRWTHLLFWKPGSYYFKEKKRNLWLYYKDFKKNLKPNKKCKKSQPWNILPWIWEVTVWMPCGIGGLSAVVAVLQGPGLLSGIQNLILWKRAPTSFVEYCMQPKGGLTLAHWEWSSQQAEQGPSFSQSTGTQEQVKPLNINLLWVLGLSKNLRSLASTPCWKQGPSPFEQCSYFSFKTQLKKDIQSLSFLYNSQVVRMLAL